MIENVNININKDDHSINDYLYCFAEFGEMPSKIKIFNNYDIDKFIEFTDKNSTTKNISKEFIPSGSDFIINEKHFINIDDIFISFVEYDKMSESGHITDIVIFYRISSESSVNSFLESIHPFLIDYENVGVEQKFNVLTLTPEGLQLEPIDLLNADYENIELYFNKDVIKKSNKLIKIIRKKHKGLSIIHGERGVGKTTLINHMLSKIDKLSIFIPANMIDIITTNEFKNFIRKHKKSIIIIDDCEIYFSNSYSKSNILTNNILQMVDGITSDMDNLHIITVLNTDNINDVDSVLLECNNFIDVMLVDRLIDSKSNELCEYLKQKNKIKNPRLIDILKNKKEDFDIVKIGFH